MADKAVDALIEHAATLIAWSNDESYPTLTPERQYHYRKQASPLYAAGLLSNPVPKPTSAETHTASPYVTASDVSNQLLRMSYIASASSTQGDNELIAALWEELRHPPTRTDPPTEQFTNSVRAALMKMHHDGENP